MQECRNWKVVEDTTAQVPGYMVPVSHPTPYWSETLLSEPECDDLYQEVMRQYDYKQPARVYKLDGTGDEINREARYTYYYDINNFPNIYGIVGKFNRAVENCARVWWDRTATPVYTPQILSYETHCKFATHCDNAIYTNGAWNRNDIPRDITGILYASDCVDCVVSPNQHQGGELNFPNIGCDGGTATVVPYKGLLVVFPSHPVYRHQVYPVLDGYRVALVNWWTLA